MIDFSGQTRPRVPEVVWDERSVWVNEVTAQLGVGKIVRKKGRQRELE